MSCGQKIKELHIIYIAGYYSGVGRFPGRTKKGMLHGKMHGQGLAKQRSMPDAPRRWFLRLVRIFNGSVLKRRGDHMNYLIIMVLITGVLFIGMFILLEAGRRIGLARMAREDDAGKGLAAVEGAVYGLLGLLIAFTFSGAASRYETRRHLIVEEANAIGTAYLRLDLLSAVPRDSLKEKFRRYVDSRLDFYRKIQDPEAARQSFDKSVELQGMIWSEAVAAGSNAPIQQAPMLLLPALNQMIDITTTRAVALQLHPPAIIFCMLGGLAFLSALLAGYSMAQSKTHSWLHMFVYAAILALIYYVILDLEFPRLGLIRIDAADELLVSVRQAMK
jgi:hypothetical protein